LPSARSKSGGSESATTRNPINFVWKYSISRPPETVPADDQQRSGKEQSGEAEEADEDPGKRRTVIADGVADFVVGGGENAEESVGVIRHERSGER